MADKRNRTPFYGAVPTSKINADHVIGMEDYIVEEGTEGIWTYRKWKSGVAECWGTSALFTVSITTVYGNTFYGNASPEYTYPTGLFSEIPNTYITLNSNTGVWPSITDQTATSFRYYPYSGISADRNFTASFYAVGK